MELAGRQIALVAKTPADARDYLIEGPGGFLKNTHPRERPQYEPTKRRVTWPNGSWATVYSDEEPDQLRGFSGDTALLDEMGKYKNPEECWANLAFGMREVSTDRVRRMITTTPRPLNILKKIEAMPGTITVHGSSYENRANLDPAWFADIILEYEGTRTGRQEIYAEYVEEVVGALFNVEAIDAVRCRVGDLPQMRQTVVTIDPSGAGILDKQDFEGRPKNDEIGIVVASLGVDERAYLRADESIVGPPELWGKRAVAAYHSWHADHILAEANFGGDMVAYVIRSIDPSVPVKVVRAGTGKHIRAEPVAALYHSMRDGVRHVGTFPKLEDQLIKFTTLGYEGPKSPDRADAWIWAVLDLVLAGGAHSWIEYYRRLSQAHSEREMENLDVVKSLTSDQGFALVQKPSSYELVRLLAPNDTSQVYGIDGRTWLVIDHIVKVPEEDAKILQRIGWQRLPDS